MNKQVYQSPKVSLVYVTIEESIAVGSYPNSVNIDTEGIGTHISDYEVYEENNKDFNLNF
ncbi:MAG: hypothetical protein ACI35V_10020 [Sphingobacterium composti]|uniref:hypothetical protein n=1 Tax=Sphingobacterium composti TaxID=363260 RepID=UPI00135C3750|nr:hypothetical protein [Sphingobacterium composti Ten et al. 2007 non Yoo et al. 2007]